MIRKRGGRPVASDLGLAGAWHGFNAHEPMETLKQVRKAVKNLNVHLPDKTYDRQKANPHLKDALFYGTEKGAKVFMSLIHTAELSGVNLFD
jgi:hypothetical protein